MGRNEKGDLALGKETVILCGDGRSDSPIHSAKYGTHILMEQFLDVIVDLEIIDKRETGGVSTNMEVAGLRKLLERIVGKLVLRDRSLFMAGVEAEEKMVE